MDSVDDDKAPYTPYTLTQCPPVNIEFQDLSYSVKGRGECKQILKQINGTFCSGELTAILGSSGSGKTTLLNVLSGCTLDGITGNIIINGKQRKMKHFHKITTYIMQENYLQPQLSVNESLLAAAALKLGNGVSLQERKATIKEVLNLLKLGNCNDTRVEYLSGGEKKRLAIALEIVSNPPVIFLDEPMSGLDTVAIKQCVEVLQILASQGRTVVCTVHQPSVPTFQKFDQVYFLADGMCVYNGSTSNIVPFLSSIDLECPVTYSPAEFVIESTQVSKENLSSLADAIQNGKINKRDHTSNHISDCSVLDTNNKIKFAASFWLQFSTLYGRMMLQTSRNKARLGMQLFCYLILAITYGLLFLGIGNNAELATSNFKYFAFSTLIFMYLHMYPHALLFPFEFELLKREYFNRWYGLKPYFLALILRNIPSMTVLGLLFIVITYTMTDQPLEWHRFLKFCLVCLLVAFASEGLGLAIGSVCSPTSGAVAAPAASAHCVFLGIYGMGYGLAIEYSMKIAMCTSYIRLAIVALHLAMLEDRPQFDCLEEMLICFYKDPKHILRDFGMLGHSYWIEILGLTFFVIFYQLIAFFALRYRLSTEFAPKIANIVTKILRYK